MIPLSRAVMRMSTYKRDNQKQKWYDDGFYICTTDPYIGDQIEDECRRRKIRRKCTPFVTERSTNKNKVRSEGYKSGYIYKIAIYDTGLKVKQLADWAITTFNDEEIVFLPDDILSYNVWIQPRREVGVIILSEEDYYLKQEPKYPQMVRVISNLMQLRPQRTHRTDLLYLYGPPGTGKTTQIFKVLSALKSLYGIDFYCKMGGLKKFWDGYDNQEICWIDDPVMMGRNDDESIQELKNVISTGHCRVEIKFGSMIFDSKLIIISCNTPPLTLAGSCGLECRDAIFRRFTDTCGAWYLESQDKVRGSCFVDLLIDIVSASLQKDLCKVGLHAALDEVNIVNYYNLTEKYNFET